MSDNVFDLAVPNEVSVLEPFVAEGIFNEAEVHLAALLARVSHDTPTAGATGADDLVLLAVAVAARAPRSGHVGVELADVERVVIDHGREPSVSELAWPDPAAWAEALVASSLVAGRFDAADSPVRPLVWDGRRLYLNRLWQDESLVAELISDRTAERTVEAAGGTGAEAVAGVADPTPTSNTDALATAFCTDAESDRQHLAGQLALDGRVTVIIGGPGTGKTRTVARLLAAALLVEPELRFALCAPTGKAAARMTEAVGSAVEDLAQDDAFDEAVLDRLRSAQASTVHRLIGRNYSGGVRYHRDEMLPYDLVVVDETSMVDLPLMARLLDALHPESRLVLVGDPDQLQSVGAGTVLSDLVDGTIDALPGSPSAGTSVLVGSVVELTEARRFAAGSGIAAVADAIRRGDADAVVTELDSQRRDVRWVRPDDIEAVTALQAEVLAASAALVSRARDGDAAGALAASRSLKVLGATWAGTFGVAWWGDLIEAAMVGRFPALRKEGRWAAGRPFMVTRNDPVARVANGDTGVVMDLAGQRVLAIDSGTATPFLVPVARLDQVDRWWAMTIHKSQGSEFGTAVVSLPTHDSPVLSRQLLYTGVTRARDHLVVVASEATVRTAVERPAARASGLADRLRR